MPNGVYRALPMWFKRVFLFEFSIYETDFLRDAQALEE
jgi:hypothetical protein